SKFSADAWGIACAQLSKKSGGRAVKLFLDRATELKIAGNRPSVFAKVKMAAKKDGTITAWQSETWSTGGFGGGGLNADIFPYVFRNVPNRRIKHTAVKTNAGSARAWRAPMHPQVSYVTCTAMEDLAAKLNIDSLEFFTRNTQYTNKPEVYSSQLKIAAELANWKGLWHPRGDSGKSAVKRGLGIGVNMWGGGGGDSNCRATIQPDGSVDIERGSQDLGTGTRTVIAMVAAETFGLPVNAVKVKIGQNAYPSSSASGGSITVGGVSSSTRKATVNALDELYAKVAPVLGAAPTDLEAVNGKIQVKDNPAKSLTWKAACRKLGVTAIAATGANVSRTAAREGLNTSGVSGVQIADVSVDIETGIVKLNRLIAVQDCGLIINPKTAESQVFGAGRMLNADMEFYKLAGIGDIGDIVVHLDIRPEHDKRGVIGLGEPPAIGGIGAISNAVANAIGVRVPSVPLTPRRVLTALEWRNA
ncbi:MAG: molybdopterin-dependent oxidoreductase, partial [Acidobacteria bacterium]|nr:molybdopterin-dependent oxidoreductase [Acidobacteriota bacterium]